MNSIHIIGRLTKDPEARTTASGKQMVKLSVAVNKGKDKDADFFDVTVFDRHAEFVMNYLTKGRLVGVSGAMNSNKGTNGTTYWGINANQIEGLDKPKDDIPQGTPINTRQQTTGGADEYDPFADE
jgi:single-strand DNA-binding protein